MDGLNKIGIRIKNEKAKLIKSLLHSIFGEKPRRIAEKTYFESNE
jgi:hypothetical protein